MCHCAKRLHGSRVAPPSRRRRRPCRASRPGLSSHRRASATSASASPARKERGPSSPTEASRTRRTFSKTSLKTSAHEAFVASWRASLPTMEPNERAVAHRASCAEGRRKANGKRRKRAVRSRTRTFVSLFCLPRSAFGLSSSRSSASRRRPRAASAACVSLVIHQYWHQPDCLVRTVEPWPKETVPPPRQAYEGRL